MKTKHKIHFIFFITANIVSKVTNFAGVALYSRILPPSDYGTFVFCFSIISLIMLLDGLGISISILQFSSQYKYKAKKITIYSIRYAFKVNLLLLLICLIFSFILLHDNETSMKLLLSMFGLPFTYSYISAITSYLRGKKKINIVSSTLTIQSFLLLFLGFLGAYFGGIFYLIIGMYIANIITVLLFSRRSKISIRLIFRVATKPTKDYVKRIKAFGISAMFTNIFSRALYLIDTLLLGILIHSMVMVSYFKVASTIPFALLFIPVTLFTYFYPFIVENRSHYQRLFSLYIKLFSCILIFSLLIAFFAIFFADEIITLLFSSKYSQAFLPFQILMASYIISSSFRIINGNFISAAFKIKTNLLISAFAFITNIILSPPLIFFYGIVGASISVFTVTCITSILSSMAMYREFKLLKKYEVTSIES